MQYLVFVKSHSDNKFVASVVGMPDCVGEGSSREEAVAHAKAALEEQLVSGELVTIEVNSFGNHSKTMTQMKHMGIFANDPTFDDFMEKLAAIRQEANTLQDEQ